MNKMLSMQSIAKVFRTDTLETHALRDVTFDVGQGEFVSVSGPSGSGKTTFLNIAGLLETFEQGTYLLDGEDVSALKDAERSRLRNEKIGFVFQSFHLIPDLNVCDNVDGPLRYRGFNAKERRSRIEAQLERVGLSQRMTHLPSQLSGGQQQRVAIARALAGEPRFLLADEPTGNLDSATAAGIMELLFELNRAGTTIIMVTHDPEIAASTGRVVSLRDGQVQVDQVTASQPEAAIPA